MRRGFALEEIDALKVSPLQWTQDDYRLMGECEYWLRVRKTHLGLGLRQQLHGLVRRAVLAYSRYRNDGSCPWAGNYEWKGVGDGGVLADAVEADPVQVVPTLRLTQANGETNDYTLSDGKLAQVLSLLGAPASKEDEMAAVKAAVALELEGVTFEGGSEIDTSAPVADPQPAKPGSKRRGPMAVAEGARL